MNSKASTLFAGLFLLVNLRGSFGYIFRFGDPLSSPAYSELPPAWYFYLWDILMGLLIALVVYKTRFVSVKYLVFYCAVLIFVLINSFQAESFYVIGMSRSIALNGFVFLCIVSASNWMRV